MAHIIEPRVRETCLTEGTSDFELNGRMRGSLAFGDVMEDGDTCDYVASYGDTFEEGTATYDADNDVLERTTVRKSRHANGTIDTNKVSFAAGVKTIILDFASSRLRDFYSDGALRCDIAQSLSSGQKNQAQANIGRLTAESGTRMVFHQSSAPVGWTKDTSINDKAIRIVSGSVGSGGSLAFSTVFGRTSVDGATLTDPYVPPHTHTGSGSTSLDGTHTHDYSGHEDGTAQPGGGAAVADDNQVTRTSTSGGLHNHTYSFTTSSFGGGASHQHSMDIRVQYVDVIIAQKD